MKIAILTNGTISDYEFYRSKLKDYDFIICADGGLNHAFNMGILPQVAIGDFDSTPKEILHYYENKSCKIIRYSTIKDETDTEIALGYAMDQKPELIDIFAGLGNRFDHSLANVHLLKKGLDHCIALRIITENNVVMLIDSYIQIHGEIGDGISLLPLTQSVEHIFTKGLAYRVTDGTFNIGEPYGVSNVMDEPVAEIRIKAGLLLVIKYQD